MSCHFHSLKCMQSRYGPQMGICQETKNVFPSLYIIRQLFQQETQNGVAIGVVL
jgi:hypothetical protein